MIKYYDNIIDIYRLMRRGNLDAIKNRMRIDSIVFDKGEKFCSKKRNSFLRKVAVNETIMMQKI